ncbi:MAG: Site-specific DNA-methyltransferase (Adenine-specific) [Candidatus Amesbacteria bacterium GW2011_GWA2_42_12]|uniref:Site-specific DNA-methyltransferase (Adenine-specific) n=1 Tax=Candidatus Amesbacteria bacterium GW2011_GWA2_42_12 TaxID=1618356 RepID=A0A0G1B2V3_9BACT|nr:MAG: Site-specific DNA-methyltransferase (Adenine-specific) [Candidatus Amesbacteria bacterium GW2011_GWA2_42_12]
MPKKSLNENLHKAGVAKKDEFYTQLADIEKEIKHYKDQFRGKVVFCNCDDPKESNFVKYFSMNFEHLGLKKLIATHYKDANLFTKDAPYKLEYTGDKNGNRMPDPDEFLTKMIGTGDFRSEECIELLKEADIVVTNPPFSLFREYLIQLTEYDKKFLIIGNTNAITYREFFKLIKDNKLRTGYTNFNVGMFFVVPDNWEHFHHIDEDGKKIARVSTSCWFTNLEVEKHKQDITLYKKYNPKEYLKYDNYDAIEVPKVSEIPMDYKGVMGVPITFLDKYNPDQFEIIGLGNSRDNFTPNKNYINPYKIMRDGTKKNGNAINCVLAIETKIKPDDIYYISDNSKYLIAPYARVLIKNKKVKK